MDPHTSVAQAVTEHYLAKTHETIPVLIAATAHWSKFAQDIYPVICTTPKESLDVFQKLEALNQQDQA